MWQSWLITAQVELHRIAKHSHGSNSLSDNWFLIAAVLAIITAFALWQARTRPYFLIGWLWFRETLTLREFLGMAVLAASILVIAIID